MKTKHLFMTFGVALAMGMATMSSCAVREAMAVNAATATTVYYAISSEDVGSYTVKLNINRKGDGDDWVQSNMEKLTDKFGGKDVYKSEFTDLYDGLGAIQFQLYNGDTWVSQDQAFGDKEWTSPTVYNGKIWVHGVQGWQTYTPDVPVSKFTVTTHVTQVDGTSVVDGSQEVNSGEQPNKPLVGYGQAFEGWYSDAGMTTPLPNVTADTVAYGRIVNRATTAHTVDTSLVPTTFSYVYAYIYDKTTMSANSSWPGVDITSTKVVNLPDNSLVVITDGQSEGTKQTVDIETGEGQKAYIRILNAVDGEGKYTFEWATEASDVPATTGYYVMSSENAWNFATAPKMSTEDLDVGNCAEYFGYSGKKNEKIYVRGWTKDTENDDPHNSFGHFNGSDIEGVGHKDEDGNFVFDADKEIDIFAKWEETELHFYVREAVESFDITVYHVKFTGATKTEKEATPHVARATEGIDFEYEFLKENYVLVGLYTDEACTVAAPKQFTEATTVYAKFVRSAGIYVFHDPDWNLETAFYLDIENKTNPDNYCEGTVVVPNTASVETPYKMKPFTFDGEAHAYDDYGLGMDYSYASLDTEHNDMKFTKGGTYAVYVQVGEGGHATVWLNEGLAAFNTKFHNEVNAVCDAVTGNTDLDELKAVWLGLEVAYNELSEADQNALKAHADTDSAATYSAYEYIIHKYGTAELNDFIFNRDIEPSAQYIPTSISNETIPVMIIVIASVMLLSAATVTTVIVLKKTRFHK